MSQHKSIRVASYNILHNTSNVEQRYLSLVKEISLHNPDVIGFQECFDTSWETLCNLLKPLGYIYTHTAFNYELKHNTNGAKWAGNSIVSKHPLQNSKEILFNNVTEHIPATKIPSAILTEVHLPSGEHFSLLVHHAVWRAENEKYRYWQAEQLTHAAEVNPNPGSFTVLLGDFNATENGQTMRYLTGDAPDRNGDFTYWVDAYKLKGTQEDYATSSPELYWAKETARITGITYPEELPDRRIDYILVKNWIYGSNGSPLTFGRMGTTLTGDKTEPTDHYGIYSDLLIL